MFNGAKGASIIIAIVVIGFIGICILMILHAVPDSPMLNMILGALSAKFGDAVQYFTGSTASSKAKDEVIAGVATAQKDPVK